MVKNNNFNFVKFLFGFIFVFLILGVVYGSGWHIADEIIDGTFGGDYIFSGILNFTDATVIGIAAGGDIPDCVDGDRLVMSGSSWACDISPSPYDGTYVQLPSGDVEITSFTSAGYEVDRAFDGILGGAPYHSPVAPNQHLHIDYGFGNNRRITNYSIYNIYNAGSNIYTPNKWDFKGSHDGVSWTILDSQDVQAWETTDRWKNYSISAIPDYYRFYMFDFTSEHANYLSIDEIEFFDRTDEDCPSTTVPVATGQGWNCFDGRFDDISQSGSKTISSFTSAGYKIDNAFDNVLLGGTPYHSPVAPTQRLYIDHGFGNHKRVVKYSFYNIYNAGSNIYTPNSWTLKGSNDGTNWVDLDVQDAQAWDTAQRWKLYEVSSPDYYRFYSMVITSEHASYLTMDEIKFYDYNFENCSAGLTPVSTAQGWNCHDDVSVDISSAGTKSISSIYSVTHVIENAFNEILFGGTPYISASGVNTAKLNVDYGFGNFRKMTKYSFFSSYSNNDNTPNSWVLRGSLDGVTWVDLDSQDTQAWAIEERWKLYEISSPDYYRFYMLDIADEAGASFLAFDELKFYGENFANCPLGFTASESSPGWVCYNGSFTDVSDEASKTVSSIYSATHILNNAFDEVLEGGTPYISASGVHTATVSIDFGVSNEKTLTRYDFFSSYSNNDNTPNSWTFEGSHDDTNWDVLDTRNNQAWGITERWKVYEPVSTGSYRYYRFVIADEVGASFLAFDEMKFYVDS